jgi:hypothetical protein
VIFEFNSIFGPPKGGHSRGENGSVASEKTLKGVDELGFLPIFPGAF